MFDVKQDMKNFRVCRPENVFDVHVAAYLLNPLKSSYERMMSPENIWI